MPSVPRLYEDLYARQVFTTDEAAEAADRPRRRVVEQLSHLANEGYLDRIRRGLYAVVPLDARESPPPPNPYLVASKLAEPYVLSYHTGLELHGVAQSSFNTLYVATPNRFKAFEHRGISYKPVRASPEEVDHAAIELSVEDQAIQVADREWTAAHCLARLDLAGGLEEVLKSLAGFAYLRPEPLLEACRVIGQKNLYNRAGFVLELYQDDWNLDDAELAPFEENLSKHTDYFGTQPGQARYVKRWNLMVPENLDQVVRPA